MSNNNPDPKSPPRLLTKKPRTGSIPSTPNIAAYALETIKEREKEDENADLFRSVQETAKSVAPIYTEARDRFNRQEEETARMVVTGKDSPFDDDSLPKDTLDELEGNVNDLSLHMSMSDNPIRNMGRMTPVESYGFVTKGLRNHYTQSAPDLRELEKQGEGKGGRKNKLTRRKRRKSRKSKRSKKSRRSKKSKRSKSKKSKKSKKSHSEIKTVKLRKFKGRRKTSKGGNYFGKSITTKNDSIDQAGYSVQSPVQHAELLKKIENASSNIPCKKDQNFGPDEEGQLQCQIMKHNYYFKYWLAQNQIKNNPEAKNALIKLKQHYNKVKEMQGLPNEMIDESTGNLKDGFPYRPGFLEGLRHRRDYRSSIGNEIM